ncbi:hypothetical protein ACFLSE_08355 [Bacteroidota bacterium]
MKCKIVASIATIVISQSILANKKFDIIKTNIQFDFRTMHLWRGSATSYVPTFEPTFEVTNNNYTTGIWFAQSIDENYTELDLYFTYNFRNFSFTIYDYYCPPSIQASSEFSNYNKYTTNHTLELDLSFNGTQYLPIKILVATMIYGDDLNPETNTNFYSTYLELGYTAIIDKNSVDLFLGLNTFQSYYGEKFGIINAGLTASRNLKVNKTLEVPIQASLVTNPMTNSIFINLGFTL